MIPMQSIGVYQFSDRIVVHPWQQTESGLGIASEPYLALPADADSGKLGEAVLDILARSGGTVAPDGWQAQRKARLKAAGVKSERAFQSGARYVRVALDGEKLLIEPSHNGGTTGDAKGHAPLTERSVTLGAGSSARDIGAAVQQGFRNCT